MSKYETSGAYPQRSLLSAEAAFTVWPSLSVQEIQVRNEG